MVRLNGLVKNVVIAHRNIKRKTTENVGKKHNNKNNKNSAP